MSDHEINIGKARQRDLNDLIIYGDDHTSETAQEQLKQLLAERRNRQRIERQASHIRWTHNLESGTQSLGKRLLWVTGATVFGKFTLDHIESFATGDAYAFPAFLALIGSAACLTIATRRSQRTHY